MIVEFCPKAGLEGEIDELVFNLYGLGKEDREIINSFLEKTKA
jgi:hypothetical protein